MRAQHLPQSGVLLLFSVLFSASVVDAGTIDVTIQGFTYTGQDVTISVGDTVRWTNLDSTTHTVTEGFVHPPNGSEVFNHSFPPCS